MTKANEDLLRISLERASEALVAAQRSLTMERARAIELTDRSEAQRIALNSTADINKLVILTLMKIIDGEHTPKCNGGERCNCAVDWSTACMKEGNAMAAAIAAEMNKRGYK